MDKPLDRTDFAILQALQNDARLSNKELAQQVHLAPSSCLERVRRLRERGVLRGFHAVVEPKAMGIGLQALIAVSLSRHDAALVRQFQTEVLEQPEVMAVYYLAGAVDFLVHVAVRDAEHLRDLAVDGFSSRDGVTHVETSLIFEHARRPELPCYR